MDRREPARLKAARQRHAPYAHTANGPSVRSVRPLGRDLTVVVSEGPIFVVAISSLHWNVSETDLAELFGQAAFPGFLGARILFDSAGRSEGHAVCTYDSEETAVAATNFFNGRSFDGMAMEVTYAGKMRPDVSNKESVISITEAEAKASPVLSRLGARPVQSRLGAKPVQSRLGPPTLSNEQQCQTQIQPQKPTQKNIQKHKRASKQKDLRARGGDHSKEALDNDLDRYMKQPHKAPDPRQVISYEDITPMSGEDPLLS